jgi:hypothetical protein
MTKTALVAFNGDMMCFVHVLLNALDQKAKGFEVALIIEGAATKLVPDLLKSDNQMHPLFKMVRDQGLLDCVCRACAAKMGVLETVQAEGLPLGEDMNGHPSLGRYIEEGFQVITF